MLTILLLVLLIAVILKKPTIVEDFCNTCGFSGTKPGSFKESLNNKYVDYTNYLCSTRDNKKAEPIKDSACISVPLIDQRPINTHPNSVKPLNFVAW